MTDTRSKTLLIRADASAHIGTGHMMRCLALAQAWQDAGGHAIFAMAMQAPALETRLCEEGMETVHLATQPGSADDARQTVDLARRMEASTVVVDGYHFDAGYQRIIKDAGLRLLFIDDYGHADYYWADLVLNQNIHAHSGLYANRAPYTQLLLGTRYVLLRREFLKWREWERGIPSVARKVLVTFGGGDLDNVTLKVIHALQQAQIDGLEAVVVVGGSNPHHEALKSAVRDSQVPIRLKSNVANMPELMAWADVAISAGGTTVWELAFMGVPTIGLSRAEHETALLYKSSQYGITLDLGNCRNVELHMIANVLTALVNDKEQLSAMSGAGRSLIDGLGPTRVINAMREKQQTWNGQARESW